MSISGILFQLVSCKLDTAHKTVTFQFAPDSDKPSVIAEKLVRLQHFCFIILIQILFLVG